jgi:polyhydroxybutyrate depolymerase
MKKALRILARAGAVLALVIALAFYLVYAPAPEEPRLSASPRSATIMVGPLQRRYLLYAPARRPPSPALLIVFHGSMGSPGTIRRETGFQFDQLADRHGFVVAYPQGFEGNWNDCRKAADYPARRLGIDDVGFFEALVARLRDELGIDTGHVFVAGVSNGGHFVYRLALERPERIAGAAVFAANLPTSDNDACKPRGSPPPMIIVNGTNDPINPYQGGIVTLFGFGNRGTVLSARSSAAWFAGAGAARPAVTRIPARTRSDGSWVEQAIWRTPGRSEVALLTVHGGGHVVPQPVYRPPRLLGGVTSAIDGPVEVWRFFRRQPSTGPTEGRSPRPNDGAG